MEKQPPNYLTIRGPVTRSTVSLIIMLLSIAGAGGCDQQQSDRNSIASRPSKLIEIQSRDHFNTVAAESADQLLLFEFFADWCYPCKQLEPILEKIARNPNDPVRVYKVNYDIHPSLAELLEVRGLPFVAFVKNKTVVYTLMGLHSEDDYLKVIRSFSDKEKGSKTL